MSNMKTCDYRTLLISTRLPESEMYLNNPKSDTLKFVAGPVFTPTPTMRSLFFPPKTGVIIEFGANFLSSANPNNFSMRHHEFQVF